MSDFNIGDTVRLIENFYIWKKGDEFEVVEEGSIKHGEAWIDTGVVELSEEYRRAMFEVVGDVLVETLVRNKYMREISPGVWIDVYDVLYAFKVTDPCLQHLIKKALAAGQRGHKDERQDLVDIRDSAQRALDSHDKWLDSES
jgi:hypothetical protein